MLDKCTILRGLSLKRVRADGELMGEFTTQIKSSYSVWIVEHNSDSVIVLINEDDNDIAGVLDAETGKIVYLHPRSIDGFLLLWNT